MHVSVLSMDNLKACSYMTQAAENDKYYKGERISDEFKSVKWV